MDRKAVDVIVLSWNGMGFLERCLSSLLRQTYPHYHILVVDNASTDGSVAMVRQRFSRVEVIENDRNLGFAGGMNVGLRHAQGGIIVLLNQDTEVREDWLEWLVEAMESDERIGIVGCKLLYPDGKTLQYAGGILAYPLAIGAHRGRGELDRGQYNTKSEVDFVTGAALGLHRALLEEIGLLDEGFFFYYEDADLCFRAKEAGYRVIYMPKAVAIHHEGISVRHLGVDHYSLLHKSRLTFVLKHYSAAQIIEDFLPAEKAFYRTLSPLELEGLSSAYEALLDSWSLSIACRNFKEEEGELVRNSLRGVWEEIRSQREEVEAMSEEIDVEGLMERISQRVREKREEAMESQPEEIFGIPVKELATLEEDLVEDLTSLSQNPEVWVNLELSEEPPKLIPVLNGFWRMILPLLNRFWGLIRRQAHELVIFYVNRLATQQSRINAHSAKLLLRLAGRLYEPSVDPEISRLRSEVDELKERIRVLEEDSAGKTQNQGSK